MRARPERFGGATGVSAKRGKVAAVTGAASGIGRALGLAARGDNAEDVHRQDPDRARRYEKRLLRMPPEKAVGILLDGVERGDPRVLVGADAMVVDLLLRLLPNRQYPRLGVWLETWALIGPRPDGRCRSREGGSTHSCGVL